MNYHELMHKLMKNYELLHPLISQLSGTSMSSKSFIHDLIDEKHLKTFTKMSTSS